MQDFNFQFASLAFFALNSLLFSFFILFKSLKEEVIEGKWLSAFVFLCSLYVSPYMFGYMNWYAIDGYREFLFYVPFQQLFLIGPVFYGYVLTILNPNEVFLNRRNWLHFMPAALYGIYSLIAFLGDALILDDVFFYADGRDKDLLPWYQFAGLISMIAYAVLSLIRYKKYRKQIVQELSYADSVVYRWVQLFLICLILILLIRIVFIVLFPNFGSFGIKYWYYLAFSMLIYFVTLNGISHLITAINLANLPFVVTAVEAESSSENLANKSKEELPLKVINEEMLEARKVQLLDLMVSQKLYENPQLSLQHLATNLQWNLKECSYVINQGFNKNFNDFVNTYRVDAVKHKLETGQQAQHTLLALALESGFNSKSTFNRVFKRMTGLSPNEYVIRISK